MAPSDHGAGAGSLIVFLFGLLLFASPFTEWWAARQPPWYTAYALWLLLIVLIGLVVRRLGRHDL
ncbi:hypothetical protein [Sediminicurvatus halobius]|uniref:Uncharacterized protein n=1 Tax=Sediminicurvatus halobius TaxID=2182432 RepID=A0A2U2N3D0_9GAMM|nr:hypothetical protein [Spiribacter halobius]PWG63548.1 hypothetical protein DEM34_08295 [Spiribacter halobius]UEX79572.1 hypothetical protein LMH63_07980 [Spiribacter halobius]